MSPQKRRVLNVAIIGPMDADNAKADIERALRSWNRGNGNIVGLHLDPQRYPIDTAPTHRPGLDGQGITIDQIIRDADIVFAVFHRNLGSPTARGFGSGTEEEIETAIETGKPCHVFFVEPTPVDGDPQELKRLEAFRRSLHQRSFLTGTWPAPDGWGGLVSLAIGQDIKDLGLLKPRSPKKKHKAPKAPGPNEAARQGPKDQNGAQLQPIETPSQVAMPQPSIQRSGAVGLKDQKTPGDGGALLRHSSKGSTSGGLHLVETDDECLGGPQHLPGDLMSELEVFISCNLSDSKEHADVVPVLVAGLRTEFSKKAVQAQVKGGFPEHRWKQSSDFLEGVTQDLLNQPIFVPIITTRWLRSTRRLAEYGLFPESYGLSLADPPELCARVAKRVHPLVLDSAAVPVLGTRREHAAQTLLRYAPDRHIQSVPDLHEIPKASIRDNDKSWDRWVGSLANSLVGLHQVAPPKGRTSPNEGADYRKS